MSERECECENAFVLSERLVVPSACVVVCEQCPLHIAGALLQLYKWDVNRVVDEYTLNPSELLTYGLALFRAIWLPIPGTRIDDPRVRPNRGCVRMPGVSRRSGCGLCAWTNRPPGARAFPRAPARP